MPPKSLRHPRVWPIFVGGEDLDSAPQSEGACVRGRWLATALFAGEEAPLEPKRDQGPALQKELALRRRRRTLKTGVDTLRLSK